MASSSNAVIQEQVDLIPIDNQEFMAMINQSFGSIGYRSNLTFGSDSSIHRVRSVIGKLNYKHLVNSQVVPDLSSYFQHIKTKRYHTWVYNAKNKGKFENVFPCMGFFYDGLIRKMLSQLCAVDWGTESPDQDIPYELRSSTMNWNEVAWPFMQHLLRSFDRSDLITDQNRQSFNKRFGLYGTINKQLTAWFRGQIDQDSKVYFNTEFTLTRNGITIAGHPDLVTEYCVIDIKTSSGFKSMAEETFKQVLAYVALMRENGRNIPYVGVLLPLQCEQIIIDVGNWDHKPYLDALFRAVGARENIMMGIFSEIPYVGHTIAKMRGNIKTWGELIRNRIEAWGQILPAQILLTGQLTIRNSLTVNQLKDIKFLVNELKLPLYNHAPYTINLAKPWNSKNPNDTTYWVRSCIEVLKLSDAIGARGMVIHTGKPTKVLDPKTGLANMIRYLHEIIPEATEQCPLLLETPAGQGTELGSTLQEFIDIYSEFNTEERKRFKVCIDTCHVWAAGHDPYEYLLGWERAHGCQSIGLVHFNDSQRECGCRVDRHHYYTRPGGYIGYEILRKVAEWCNERNIDMVTE